MFSIKENVDSNKHKQDGKNEEASENTIRNALILQNQFLC